MPIHSTPVFIHGSRRLKRLLLVLLFAGGDHAHRRVLPAWTQVLSLRLEQASCALNENKHTRLWLPASLYLLHPWSRLNTYFQISRV